MLKRLRRKFEIRMLSPWIGIVGALSPSESAPVRGVGGSILRTEQLCKFARQTTRRPEGGERERRRIYPLETVRNDDCASSRSKDSDHENENLVNILEKRTENEAKL